MTSRHPDADESPGFLLWRAQLAWRRTVSAALEPFGLTHVQFVLLVSTWWLAGHGDPPRQRDLAEHAGTDPMMTSQVVRTLMAKGLIDRVADPEDARAWLLSVTPDGAALAARAIVAVEDVDDAFFSALPPSDREKFITGLARLAQWPGHSSER